MSRKLSTPIFIVCLAWLVVGLEVARAQDGRVPLIMSKLPPQASVPYRALKRRAGNVVIEVLPLTRAEVWSVLREAGDRQASSGAQWRGYGELAADWNHVFRPMPAHASMGQAHKAMLAKLEDRGSNDTADIFPRVRRWSNTR